MFSAPCIHYIKKQEPCADAKVGKGGSVNAVALLVSVSAFAIADAPSSPILSSTLSTVKAMFVATIPARRLCIVASPIL